MAVGNAITLFWYTLGVETIRDSLPPSPSWTLPALAVGVAINLFAVLLIWHWKKAGFYLAVAVGCISVIINVSIYGASGAGTIIFGAFGILILYPAMKPAWQNFR